MNSRIFADKTMPFLEKYNKYTEKERIVVHYGLEALYINSTKLILILIISLLLGITREMFGFLFFYGLLRTTAGGLHLSGSLSCTVMSSLIFIIGTYLCMYSYINIGLRIIIAGLCFCFFVLYSPADTKKRPLFRENIRNKRKFFSCITCLIYLGLVICFNNNYFQNILTYSLILQSLLILPPVYKIFRQPYKNYVAYLNYNRKEG